MMCFTLNPTQETSARTRPCQKIMREAWITLDLSVHKLKPSEYCSMYKTEVNIKTRGLNRYLFRVSGLVGGKMKTKEKKRDSAAGQKAGQIAESGGLL